MHVTDDRLSEMLAELELLVRTESPSHDHSAVAASAAVVASLIEARFGRRPESIVVDGVHHVLLRGASPRVLVLAHHDTVWPTGTLAEIPFSIVDGVIRGPGTFDMKVGLVQALHALDLVNPQVGLDSVSLLVTGDEEVGSPSSRALIETEAAGCDAVFVVEPSGDGGAIKIERKGVSNYRITVEGRAAHAGLEPEKGVNASIALAHVVLALSGLADAETGTTVTPTTLTAGTTTNTVPALATVDVDVRATTLAEQERVDAAVRALTVPIREARLIVTGGPNRPPLERAMALGLFERARVVSRESGLPEPIAIAVGGASDGNFTAGIGIPTLDGMGAVGGGAHARDEHALLDAIGPRTTLLAGLIVDVLRGGSAA
jgi:glutamate carboxypeptidase